MGRPWRARKLCRRSGVSSAGDPEPHADPAGPGGVGGQQGHVAPVGQLDAVARSGAEVGLPVASDLDRPQPGGQLGREVHLHGRPVGRRAVELGGEGARRVDHHQIALVEEAGELGEGGVHQCAVGLGAPPACGRRRGSCRGTRAGRAPRARAAGRTTAGAARADGPAPGDRGRGSVSALMPPLPSRAAPRRGSGRSGGRSR